MTHQEIKELAGHRAVSPWIMKLVSDAVAMEREQCAKLVEVSDDLEDWEIICGSDGRELLNAMAEAIRARGKA